MRIGWWVVGMVAVVSTGAVVGAPPAWSQTEYLVAPRDTDEEIDSWLAPHVVEIDRTVAPGDLLYVHIPGSYDVPANSTLILKHAARQGYPSIGLRYPNSWTVFTLCSSSADPECFEKVRLEILDGEDRTDIVDISEANSITNRIVRLLEYLDRELPDDGWRRFLTEGGEVAWSKVVVSGHSQGAGHAAMIAHIHRVSRVGMFAGPPDFSFFFDRPPEWLSDPGETPGDVHFGFGHTEDSLVPEHRLVEIWTALGLSAYGNPVSVDELDPPYGRSRMLFTSADPAVSGLIRNHNSVVVDRETPKGTDGAPLFDVVWDVMCFPDGSPENPGTRILRPGRRVTPQ